MVRANIGSAGKNASRMASWGRLIVMFIMLFSSTSCLKDEHRCPEGTVLIKKEASADDINWFDVCIVPLKQDTEQEFTTETTGDAGPGETEDSGVGQGEGCDACGDGEYCDTTLDPPACLPPPTGQGEPCQTAADCEGFEARYCENQITGTCLIQHCDVEANNCSEGYMCCDFAWAGLPPTCVSVVVWGGACYEP